MLKKTMTSHFARVWQSLETIGKAAQTSHDTIIAKRIEHGQLEARVIAYGEYIQAKMQESKQ